MKNYFLDLEMLSIKKQADMDNIIAMGMVDGGGSEWFTLIQPTNSFRQSRYCEELTGINQGELMRAPKLYEVYDEFFGHIKGNKIFTWGYKDREALKRVTRQQGLAFTLKIVDVQNMLKSYCGLRFKPGLKKTLITLCSEKEYVEHWPVDDAKMLRDVYMAFVADKKDSKVKMQELERKIK